MIFKTQAVEEFACTKISPYTRFSHSETGFSNADLVLDYLRHFNVESFRRSSSFQARDCIMLEWFRYDESDERPITKPREAIRNSTPKEEIIYRLLLIDGFTRHFSQPIGEYCTKYDILVLPLPPHLTHRIQPLDVGVFLPLKLKHQSILEEFVWEGELNFKRVDFVNSL